MDFLIVAVLSIVFFQDIRERAVSWPLFVVLAILYIVKFYRHHAEYSFLLINGLFLVIQLIGITFYTVLKYKRAHFINEFLGLGDLLIWIIFTWAFSPINFFVFHVTGLFISLLVYVFFLRKNQLSIPLAGFQCGLMIIIILIHHVGFFENFYNDWQLISLLEFEKS